MSTEAVTNKPDQSGGADRTEYQRAYYHSNKERILANRREWQKKNGPSPAQVHHLREGQGMGQRASAWLTVPLCDTHHANSSPDGIHGQRRAWKLAGVGEMDALADTIEQLSKGRT